MITGAHAIIESKSPDADRAFLRDHPSDTSDVHQRYRLCDDVEDLVAKLEARGVTCSAIKNPGWGLLTEVRLPGGGKLAVHQPRHARPEPMKP